MIRFDKVCFGYKNDIPVFKDLSFAVDIPSKKGFILGLMGDSGSGKSTLFKLLLGTEKIWSGEILLPIEYKKMSYLPQEPILFEHLSPLENADFFSRTKHYSVFFDKKFFEKLTVTLGMKDLLSTVKSVNEISGGQKQRIALLRALSIKPDILLLDEPLTGLDERVKESFLNVIVQLANKYQLLIIYISHHRTEIELIANEILYLVKDEDKGYVTEVNVSKPSDFFRIPPTISALYMSKNHGTNILPVKIRDNKLIICGEYNDYEERYDINVPEGSISFTQEEGWEFSIEGGSDKYVFLQLQGTQKILTLDSKMMANIDRSKRISINGTIDFYRCGKYKQTYEINKNRIVEHER